MLGKRRATRLIAMLEASLWVAGGLALATRLGVLPAMPAAYPVSAWVFIGGALLGFGAWLNGACVFGAIARFGSGDLNYLATPIGFYLGCLSVGSLFGAPSPGPLDAESPVLRASSAVAPLFLAFAAWRIVPPLFDAVRAWRGEGDTGALARRVWAPHAATGVIGVTFVVILLLVGVWAYTDVLAQLAEGRSMRFALGAVCLLALYVGAWLGGRSAGRLSAMRLTAAGAARCLAGGALMAWGSLLIPGSNDGLILIGMPLLRPYAWLAFATMCVTVAMALCLHRGLARLPQQRAADGSRLDAGR
ncbi:MAG TPA: YeeE/YedE thiosulfate transporter family protein [Burkholderiaceae bacterium]|nr:YeeE/YedE thiosulfate transporter family protein [Burkholderiaceae bacterium]